MSQGTLYPRCTDALQKERDAGRWVTPRPSQRTASHTQLGNGAPGPNHRHVRLRRQRTNRFRVARVEMVQPPATGRLAVPTWETTKSVFCFAQFVFLPHSPPKMSSASNAITLKGSAKIVAEFFAYGINSILYGQSFLPCLYHPRPHPPARWTTPSRKMAL